MSTDLSTSAMGAGCDDAFAKARLYATLSPEDAAPRTMGREPQHFGKLYGKSAAMTIVYQMISKVAPSEASVLLIGESGTGKELAANAIHDESSCRTGPFVAINCGAFSANLIEAELFGYERGAFTGATRSHRGCFERATGGTLFLDEITEMPVELQIKLLRAREADIELLAQHFLDELNSTAGTDKTFTAAAREYLARHDWPGNVRELKNAVQRAFIMADSDVTFDERANGTANARKAPVSTGPLLQFAVGTPLQEIEREVIVATLEHCHGRKRETAELLGVSLKTLYNRLNEYRGDCDAHCAA